MWIFLALMSALVAGISAVVAKIGLKNVDSSAGFAVQSIVILILSWLYAGATGKTSQLSRLEARDWGFLLLSGAVTTVAYLFYFGAVKAGDVSRVAPIDRLSLVFAVVLSGMFLSEKLTAPVVFGVTLMAIGALVVAVSGSSSS